MQTAHSLPMLHILTKMNKGLHSPRWGAGKEGVRSKRTALTTCLWEITNRNKTSVPTRQNTLKKQTKDCRKDRKPLATNTVAPQQMIHVKQMEIWWTVAQVWFLVKFPEVSFCVFQKRQKWNRQEKKTSNIKEEKMQESKIKDW